MITIEAIDPSAAADNARTFAVARFGRVPMSMSATRAADYLRIGWGLKMGKVRKAAFAAAIVSGEIKGGESKSFAVSYHMAPGHSAGGSSIGARPISYETLNTASIDAWARFEVMTAGLAA